MRKSLLLLTILAISATAAERIHGIVRDMATQLPLPNASVLVDSRTAATTDDQGRFTLENISPGRHRISAMLEGDFSPTGETVLLTEGAVQPFIKLQLHATASFAGQVLDDSGDPTPAARIYLLEGRYWFGLLHYKIVAHTESDPQGRYQVEHVPPDHGYLLLAKPTRAPDRAVANPDPDAREPHAEQAVGVQCSGRVFRCACRAVRRRRRRHGGVADHLDRH